MIIDKATKDYFLTCRKYDTPNQIKELIESWLNIKHVDHGISLSQYIYNKDEYCKEFYTNIYGKDETNI